jgi:peptidoglycan/LPS O-acetylase OafA/YrhL
MRLPGLRYVTQAGGRLAPEQVRRYAALGREQGWDFYVMYGQTEATARIAYLPPDLTEDHPECIGRAIPGGTLRLDPIPDAPAAGVGELVYSGPNVMLGYAQRPQDLALGRTVTELRTGDLGRLTSDGLYQVVGRASRFLKLFGLRIDLHRIEQLLADQGLTAHCTGDDTELVIAVVGDRSPGSRGRTAGTDEAAVRDQVAQACGLPAWSIRVVPVTEVPRLASGKVDYQSLRTLAAPVPPPGPATADTRAAGQVADGPGGADGADVAAIYALILGRADVTDESSFASLGGDSLSYVEASVRLEQALGTLPPHWHTMTVRELRTVQAGTGRGRGTWWSAWPGRWRSIETSVALRAVAVLLIGITHAEVTTLRGGAHILLAVVGFNFGRFHVTDIAISARAGRIGASIARIAIPAILVSAIVWACGGTYTWANMIFASLFIDAAAVGSWVMWFIDTVVYTLFAMLILLSTPWGDRAARRFPFGLPLCLVCVGLVFRYDMLPFVDLSDHRVNSPNALLLGVWVIALGWATAKATTTRQRLLLTAITLASVPGFFGEERRELIIVAGIIGLIWLPTLPSTRVANRVASTVAAASLYIYLVQFPLLELIAPFVVRTLPAIAPAAVVVGVAASFAVGIGLANLARRVEAHLVRQWRQRRQEPLDGRAGERSGQDALDTAVI